MARLIELLTISPAKLCNLDAQHLGDDGLGELREGGLADVTVIDPARRWTVSQEVLAGQSRNTPFFDWTFQARPVMTIVGGVVRMSRLEVGV